jgi:hypothetical protein
MICRRAAYIVNPILAFVISEYLVSRNIQGDWNFSTILRRLLERSFGAESKPPFSSYGVFTAALLILFSLQISTKWKQFNITCQLTFLFAKKWRKNSSVLRGNLNRHFGVLIFYDFYNRLVGTLRILPLPLSEFVNCSSTVHILPRTFSTGSA